MAIDNKIEKPEGLFDRTLGIIRTNKELKDKGGYNTIPFGLPSLDKHVPGIMKGMQYIITANSGVGKTQLTKFLFVNQPYKFIKQHPELGLKLKILYFALEETKEEFMLTLIANRLKEDYGISVPILMLRSSGEYHLSNDILNKVEACREYFAELEQSIEVLDHISNPFGIYKYVREYSHANGIHVYRNQVFKHKDGSETEETLYDHYEPYNPKEFVVVVVDHISLLGAEKGGTLHDAMTKLSAEYGRKNITKQFGYCLAIVQQQAADKEKLQFTNSGMSIDTKLEPSLDGLGDNKMTQRDALCVIGLFAPERYSIGEHLGYNIKVFKDYYRSLSILKNRVGTPNLKLPLLFNGQTNSFSELPKPGTLEVEQLYTSIKKYRNS